MWQIYIFTWRKSPDAELRRVTEELQSIAGNFVIAPAVGGDTIPHHKEQWIVIDLREGQDIEGYEDMILNELSGSVGRITVVSRVIPKSLLGVVGQVGSLLDLPRKYYFVG